MQIQTREIGDVVVFDFVDKIDIRLREKSNSILEELFGQNKKCFVCDFSKVDYIDSSGLGILISMIRKIHSVKGRMRICAVKPAIMELLVMSRLDQLFDIRDSLDKALEDFHG